MKKRITFSIIFVIILALVMPVALVIAGFALPPQFDETYYGQLKHMYSRLKNAEGKKIVLTGNSAVAFGIRSDLLEEEFPGYSVVNFGLYGAIGTKTMLDLSKSNIGKGDIIVIMPELIPQSLSLYFSAKETWRAVDGDFSMLKHIAKENRGEMTGCFAEYASTKFGYARSGKKAPASGVYSQSAFNDEQGNEAGYMTYNRPYNIMTGGYDSAVKANLNTSIIGNGFIEYLNGYNAFAKKRGASVYFGFVPVNELMTEEKDRQQGGKELYSYLREKLDFDVIGHPTDYFMDYKWFYDNNVHMNSAGMYKFTNMLADDLKLALDIKTPNKIVVPEPEIIPPDFVAGDNRDAALFDYERVASITGEYILLTGLLQEGRARTEIILPSDYGGVPVREFAQSVFAGNTVISEITLPMTIGRIHDNSFYGCTKLRTIRFEHDFILGIDAGQDFLAGTDEKKCFVYLKEGVSTTDCGGGWGKYGLRIRYY